MQILVALAYEDVFCSDSRNNVESCKTVVLAQCANFEYCTNSCSPLNCQYEQLCFSSSFHQKLQENASFSWT